MCIKLFFCALLATACLVHAAVPALRVLSKPGTKLASSNTMHTAVRLSTTKYPETCACALDKGPQNGVCYDFTVRKYCKARPCQPSYVCIEGYAPEYAATCMRKKNTQRVVSNGDGTCRVDYTATFTYVPYASHTS